MAAISCTTDMTPSLIFDGRLPRFTGKYCCRRGSGKNFRRGCFCYAASLGDALEPEPLERLNAGDGRSVPEADNSQTGRRTGLGRTGSRQFYRPMIIAMAVMWVMQPSVHKVIDVIAVWHLFVSAARTMRMRAPGFERAAHGVGIASLDNMFV